MPPPNLIFMNAHSSSLLLHISGENKKAPLREAFEGVLFKNSLDLL